LTDLFSQAASSDLEVLADLITDNGKGRVALDGSIKAIILKRRKNGNLQSIPDVLEAEIRAFGGNSWANLVRSEGVNYKEIVIDVVEKLGGKPLADDDIFALEDIVIKKAIDKYAPDGVKAPTDDSVARSGLLGHIVQRLVAASGDVTGAMASAGVTGVAKIIGAVLLPGPLFSISASQVAGPAFRITIPAVLQVAKIRRTRFETDFSAYTEGLRTCL